jgi:hypothetical protein
MKNTLAPAIRLVLPFFIWYILEYLVGSSNIKQRSGYRNISFEREAYSNETNIGYLKSRPVLNLENIWRKKNCSKAYSLCCITFY